MALKYVLLNLLIACVSSSPFGRPPVELLLSGKVPLKNDSLVYRLPEGAVEVIHYNIELRLPTDIFEKNRFEGITDVVFKNLRATNQIAIHGHRLAFSEFLRKETSFYTWFSAFNAFSDMIQKTSNESLRTALTGYILELSEVFYNSVPFNEVQDYNHIYSLKKLLVTPWACKLGLQDCVDNAVTAFANYRITNLKPDKNLRSTVYCSGLRYSTNIQSDWNFLYSKFLTTKLATEQMTILSALGCAKDVDVLKNFLSIFTDPESGIKIMNTFTAFSAAYSENPEGVNVAFDFLIENYQVLTNYFNLYVFNVWFNGLATRFTRKEQTDKLSRFIEETDLGDIEPVVVAALNTALTNINWIERFEQELADYFAKEDQGQKEGASGPTGFI